MHGLILNKPSLQFNLNIKYKGVKLANELYAFFHYRKQISCGSDLNMNIVWNKSCALTLLTLLTMSVIPGCGSDSEPEKKTSSNQPKGRSGEQQKVLLKKQIEIKN